MQESEIRILAVNPGSRYLGFAVFHGAELADWGVKSVREASAENKLERVKSILAEVADTHAVDHFAIKGLHPSRSSGYLRRLAEALREWAKEKGHVVREYTIKETEAFLTSTSKPNKCRLMEEVAAIHPFLFPELEEERRNRHPYLVRMFEAVALGMKYLSDLDESKGRKRFSVNHENKKR